MKYRDLRDFLAQLDKVGQLRISAMRERAERELGARFDVREFHSQVLRDGAVPLDVLEAKIDRWIKVRAGTSDRR